MGQLKSIDLPESGTARVNPVRDIPQTGSGGRWWVWLLIFALAIGGFWYYKTKNHKADESKAAAGGPGGKGRGAGGANFSVPVVVAAARHGDLPVFFNGLGTVTPLNTVTVRSRVDGQLINVAFREGQFVKQGDLLAEIDPRPFQVQLEQAEGQLAKDEAQRRDAEVNFERYQLLFKEGVIPKQQLDTQQAQVGQFDGAIKTDQASIDNAKLQITYSRITSPISGRVGLRLVDPGNMIHATDTNGLVVITQVQPIAAIFSLPQDQLPQVFDKLHKGATLTVEAYDRDNTSRIATGKLLTIDNQIDPTTGTYKLKAEFNNEENILFPNQFVNIHLLVDTQRNLTLVPSAAIQRGPQGTYVYLVNNANKVSVRPITLAQANGSIVGISNGLNAGDLVVIDGQDKLQDGSNVTTTLAQNSSGTSHNATSPASTGNPAPGTQPGQATGKSQ